MTREVRESVERDGLLGEVPVTIVEPVRLAERAGDPVAVDEQDVVAGGTRQARVQRSQHLLACPGHARRNVPPRAVRADRDVVLDQPCLRVPRHGLPERAPSRDLCVERALGVVRQQREGDRAVVRSEDDVIRIECVQGARGVENLLHVRVEAGLVNSTCTPLRSAARRSSGPSWEVV